jgi:transposase
MQYYKDIEKFYKGKKVFCGIDVHLKFWVVCFYCDGEVMEKSRIDFGYPQLLDRLKRYNVSREIRLVYEAGYSGFWLYRKLLADGYHCIITPPALVPRSASKVKTDKRDAIKLASYLAAGILKSIYVPPAEVESDRRVVRRRSQLVKKQTRCKNEIKAFLHLHGIGKPVDIKTCWSLRYMSWLERLEFSSGSDRFTFAQLLKHYLRIQEDIREVNHYLKQLSQDLRYCDNYKRLTSLRGIGLITAMTYLLEIYDFNRFPKSKHFSSFLGFTPSQFSSGEHVRLGHISSQGNAHLRRVLVESAWTVIKHDPHLRDKYERIRKRGTNRKKAIVAVARSLAVRLRRCLLDKTDYVIGVS